MAMLTVFMSSVSCFLFPRSRIDLLVQVLQAFAVRLVEAFELLGRAGVPDELVAGEEGGLHALREEALGDAAADHVHDHAAGDGRGGPGAPLEALELEDAVAGGALVVDDEV